MNGDGLLIYPGRDFIFPAEDRGIDGPLPSIRLKNWRRGIQDVEYLVLARQAGEGTLADQVIDTLVPRALDDNGLSGGESVPWEEDGEIWLQQRRRLADLFPPAWNPTPTVELEAMTAARSGMTVAHRGMTRVFPKTVAPEKLRVPTVPAAHRA